MGRTSPGSGPLCSTVGAPERLRNGPLPFWTWARADTSFLILIHLGKEGTLLAYTEECIMTYNVLHVPGAKSFTKTKQGNKPCPGPRLAP